MGRIRYLIIKNYKGPNVISASVSTPKYGDFEASDIKYKGNKLLIGFNMLEATELDTLTISGDNGTYTTDVSDFTGASSDIKYYDGPIFENSKNKDLSWWEFGHSDEFFLKSLVLLPFRLVLNPIFWLLGLAWLLVVDLPIGIVKFAYKIVASAFVILISIIILPFKLFFVLITFGYYKGFKERFIDRIDGIWE